MVIIDEIMNNILINGFSLLSNILINNFVMLNLMYQKKLIFNSQIIVTIWFYKILHINMNYW
jgi:hypothetical protein